MAQYLVPTVRPCKALTATVVLAAKCQCHDAKMLTCRCLARAMFSMLYCGVSMLGFFLSAQHTKFS